MNASLTTMVTSPPDREHLVVEIWMGDIQWAEVSRSGEGLLLEVFGEGPQLLPLEEVKRVLEEAEAALVKHEAEDRSSPS